MVRVCLKLDGKQIRQEANSKIHINEALLQFFSFIATIHADFLEFSHVSFGSDIDLFNCFCFKIFVFLYKIFDHYRIQNQCF